MLESQVPAVGAARITAFRWATTESYRRESARSEPAAAVSPERGLAGAKGRSVGILKGVNTALAFALELAMLVGFGYWGYHAGPNSVVGWVLAIGLPVVAISVWGAFFAPRAARRLPLVPGALLSLGLFLLAALAFGSARQPLAGGILAAVSVVNRVLVLLWRQW